VWRNSFDSRAARRGRYVAAWRRGGRRNIRWSLDMPTTPLARKKNAPTVTKKSGHTSPDCLVSQFIDDGYVDRDVGLPSLDRGAATAAASPVAAARRTRGPVGHHLGD